MLIKKPEYSIQNQLLFRKGTAPLYLYGFHYHLSTRKQSQKLSELGKKARKKPSVQLSNSCTRDDRINRSKTSVRRRKPNGWRRRQTAGGRFNDVNQP